jgi:UDP-N-acetylglucosamine acyltransferase
VKSSLIHPTAIIDPGAVIGEGCEIGPYCVLGGGVVLGDHCWLQNHVTVMGPSRIGAGNRFFCYSSIGQQTQDLKYVGEPTYLEVGDENTFREFVTVNRGTAPGSYTRIGNRGNFLAYSHVAHDCTVGDRVIFSNNGTIAGHVEVGDFAVIGGLTAVHQFCRIGAHAITGGCSKIVQDVPPFMIADGNPAVVRGLNKVGLERHGFGPETLKALREAYRILYRSELNQQQALERLEAEPSGDRAVEQLLAFVKSSQRGVIR